MRTILTYGPLRVAAALGAVGLVACSAILGVESERHLVAGDTDAGNDSASDEPQGDWSCIHAPAVDAGSAKSFTLEYFLNDVTTASSNQTFAGAPIVGANIHVCAKLDIECGTRITNAITDDGGIADLTVPNGFDGYYEVTDASDYTPSILKRTPQLGNEYALQGLAKASLIALGGKLAQVDVDPNAAFVVVTAADCASVPAPGVQFTVGQPAANEKVVYLDTNLPSASATETDSAGSAIVFNVPPGTVSITANVAATGETIRTVSALARTGWATFVQIRLDSSKESPFPP